MNPLLPAIFFDNFQIEQSAKLDNELKWTFLPFVHLLKKWNRIHE